MRVSKFGLLGAAIVLGSCVAAGAFAQDAGQPPAGRQRRGGGQFGQGRFGGGLQLSIVNVSPDILATELKLSADQKTKITDIQKKLVADRQAAFQQPADGGQPDRQAQMAKFQELNQTAVKEITAVLTDDQKTSSTALLKDLQTLQALSLPYQTYSDLKLTSEQKTKLAALAADVIKSRQDLQQEIRAAAQAQDQAKMQELFGKMRGTGKPDEKTLAVLTDSQKATVDKYVKDHPAPANRRPGGFGPGAGA